MAKNDLRRRIASPLVVLNATLFISLTCFAQREPLATPQSAPQAPSPDAAEMTTLTVPAGTKVSVALTRSVSSKTMRAGDDIYAETIFPVVVGNQTVIPQGSFVQGKIEKLARKGSRGELQVRTTSVIFPNGYVAVIPGPSNLRSDDDTALLDPGNGTKAGVAAAIAVPMGGALIGAAAAGAKGAAIGGGAGLGVGIVAAILVLSHAKNFVLEAGTPLDIVLQQPLSLDKKQISDAVRFASTHPSTPPPIARRRLELPMPPPTSTDTGTCYTPGTPGTPDIYIPGTPPIASTPGTPGTVIPGTPATPPTPHPCP